MFNVVPVAIWYIVIGAVFIITALAIIRAYERYKLVRDGQRAVRRLRTLPGQSPEPDKVKAPVQRSPNTESCQGRRRNCLHTLEMKFIRFSIVKNRWIPGRKRRWDFY